MSASEHAQRERLELADLLDRLGPDRPTLCEGWTTRDLAAHLVVREARPDALPGVNGGPTAGWTRRLEQDEAKGDYTAIVQKVRTGPPLLSVFSLPGAAAMINLAEYVVHHEDVIRAQPDWQPRVLPPDLSDDIWARMGMSARRTFGGAQAKVGLVRTDVEAEPLVFGKGQREVRISGTPLEIMLTTYGRKPVQISVDGDPDAVAALRAASLIP